MKRRFLRTKKGKEGAEFFKQGAIFKKTGNVDKVIFYKKEAAQCFKQGVCLRKGVF